LRDLKEERWITIREEENPGLQNLAAASPEAGPIHPKFGRSARSFEGMLAFVSTGEGIALLPEIFLPPQPAGLRYVDTDCAPWEMCAVWSKVHADAHVPAYLEILRGKIGAGKPAPAVLERVLGRGVRQTRTVRSK